MLHFNNNNLKRKRFSCLSYIATLLIAIQPWTLTTRSGYTGIMTAAASVKSPGEMDPKSLSILIGDNANITCRLSNPNSSQIWFIEEKTKRQIKQLSDEIKILDPYTAVFVIQNAEEQNSRYQCKVGENAIGESELYVGTKPLNVTDFGCISYDYVYMECSFTRPKNMVLTRFDLEYRLPTDNFINKCYCHSVESNKLKCNVTDYLPMRDKYLFTLKGKNDVGENVQKFEIDNHKIVIPSAVDIVKQNIGSDSIALSFEKLKISYYKNGLSYDIQIRDNISDWQTPEMEELESQNSTYNIIVRNLYAFWLYWIKIKVKSRAINNDNFWSDESIIEFRTKSNRPKRSPKTPLGSFYIDSTETQLRLYWEQMPKNEQNGPGFHYVLNEVNEHDDVVFSTKVNESSFTLPWKNESMRIFVIKSANNIGESIAGSKIRVYRSGSSRYELNENSIAKVYHNSSYTLSWSPPENMADLMNYTVFWCLPKIELPNQCKLNSTSSFQSRMMTKTISGDSDDASVNKGEYKISETCVTGGPISYKYLDKLATNFTTEPKDRSLNLAISANYPNYNKGMQWARCSGDISSELMKMELEVNALNESAILVKWSSGSVCASILKGYNLTYCQASMDDKCRTPSVTLELLRKKQEYRNYTISELPPYTNVCLYMFMYSSNKQGRISDLSCIRTKASAPWPPKDIKYIKNTLTSKSVKIQWSPPDIKNGILSHYTIYWEASNKTTKPRQFEIMIEYMNKHSQLARGHLKTLNANVANTLWQTLTELNINAPPVREAAGWKKRKYPDQIFEKNTTSIQQTFYHLTGLNSYSNYEVYVTAHTVEESVPSKRINFTTLIGIPSGPRNLNIYENDTVIYWDQPDLPSGRHLFYLVALIQQDEKFNTIYERVSIVKGRSCRFQQPGCSNSNISYALKVRAVNFGEEEEVDREIVAMNKEVILSGAPIDEGFCESEGKQRENIFEIDAKSIFQNDNEKFYFASPWIIAPRSYSCSANSKASIYAVPLLVVILFAAFVCHWLRNKYYKMKNIKVILPEGLVEQVSNYKFATNTLGNGSELGSATKKEFHSDISRSNDCLVSYGHKENLNLITNFHNGSSNALSSLSSNTSSKDHQIHIEEQNGEHPSLETTNEELSSNSSSASNSNLNYHEHCQIKRLTSFDGNNSMPVFCCDEEEEDNFKNNSKDSSYSEENVEHLSASEKNGYVTHNSQLLASILNTAERNVPTVPNFNSTFSTMTNDGYIQPSAAKQMFQPSFSDHQQQQPLTSINGYTCIESLSKLATPNDSGHANNMHTSPSITNSPVSNTSTLSSTPMNGVNIQTSHVPSNILTSLHTSPVITDLHESPSPDYKNKEAVQANGTVVPATNVSHQPNNNNTIYGYVTQQQLATFGTNVALGKELNT